MWGAITAHGGSERDDGDTLLGLAASDDFKAAFGEMGWDEAFDRYEEVLINAGGKVTGLR